MIESMAFIQDFAVVLIFAFVITLLFTKFKQPPVLGYLAAGIVIGPYALGLISDQGTVNVFAELGIILLLFSTGLDFNLKKFKKVGGTAIGIGTIEMILMIGIGNATGRILGWSYTESLFLGGVIAISSTAIILKILADMRTIKKEYANIILGVLIIEDVGAIVLLTLFGSLGMAQGTLLENILTILTKIFIFFTVTLVFGLRFIPRLIMRVGETSTPEVLLLTSLGLCFALASFSGYLGFSVALGAYMMGTIISESRNWRDVKRLTEPVRDVFASMFFISVGMLVNIGAIEGLFFQIIFISVIAIVGKVGLISLTTYFAGYKGLTALSAGLGMIPRGEFSFVIAKLGLDKGVVSQDFFLITVAISILTATITPQALNFAKTLTNIFDERTPVQVKSFFKYFYTWTSSIEDEIRHHEEMLKELKEYLKKIWINTLIITILIIATYIVKDSIPPSSSTIIRDIFLYFGYTSPQWIEWIDIWTLTLLTAGVLSLPPIYFIFKNIQNIIDLSITIATIRFKMLEKDTVRNTIRNVAYILIILLFAITILPLIITKLVGHGTILNFVLLTIIIVSGYLFWKTINRFHARLDEMIEETLFAGGATYPETREHIIESIKEDRNIGLEKIYIKKGSPVIGKNLKTLDLRNVAGITVLIIERGSETFRNPRSTVVLKEGDVLTVMGTEEERDMAKDILSGHQGKRSRHSKGLSSGEKTLGRRSER